MKENAILHQYLKEISRYPLLSASEEEDLCRRIQQGDQEARKKLIESNLRLVVRIAVEMNRGKLPLMDMIQNGNIGLIHAAEKFDYRRHIRFSHYAAYWIRQSILRYFQRDGQLETISTRMKEKKRSIRRTIESFFTTHSRLPSASDLSHALDISLFEAAQELKAYMPRMCEKPSMDLEDIPDNEENIEEKIINQCLSEEIEQMLRTMDEPARNLLCMRYGFTSEENTTLVSVARKFNLTAEGVRQRENRLLSTLRKSYPALKYYLA